MGRSITEGDLVEVCLTLDVVLNISDRDRVKGVVCGMETVGECERHLWYGEVFLLIPEIIIL
jgi:hypothetical protein